MSPSRARRCASAASRTAWPGRLISSDALMNAHPDFVLVWSAFSITSKSARITSSPVSSARRLAFVSRPSRARRLRPLSASATSRSLEPKCWYRVRFVTPARAAIASTPVPVMPRAYVSSLVAARSASCAFGRSVMAGSIRTDQYTKPPSESPRLPRRAEALASSCTLRLPMQMTLAFDRRVDLEDNGVQYTDRCVYYGSRITDYHTGKESNMPLVKVNLLKGRSDEEKESIAASIQTALISTLKVPDADRYQVFNEYDGESFRHTSGYLGMTYTDQLLIIEITFLEGRDDEVKKSLLAEINRNLVAAGVVGEDDVFVLISEIGRANVSFGKGLAQRAPTAQLAG